ncbi:MAG: hypothetical protein M3R59_07635 [Verrucomicrobiota bacterium]|nr:hypothetical protein [Verrucomicrobiota bacterium]
MNPLATDWPIQARSEVCQVTQRPFADGESFYTLLFREGDGFRREDISEEAWTQRNENIQPFSFWKSRFEATPVEPPEPLGKENAEELFRRLIGQADAPANAAYVLAAMLERKRVLKQVRTESLDGRRLLIYEHGKTGDVFIVPDPQLRLGDLESVQTEVMQLLQTAHA